MKDGEPNGQGTFTYPDGRQYVGEIKDGEPHGQGTLTWPNGKKYVGGFKDGIIHGQGSSSLHDNVIYNGEFFDSEFHGHGVYNSIEGQRCIGEWKAGYLWNGTSYDKDGNITEKYVNGELKK